MSSQRRGLRALTTVGVAAAVMVASSGVARADEVDTVTASETVEALGDVPGVLSASDTVQTTSDADSAVVATVQGTTVDVPRDASDGVTLSSADASLNITPPDAADAGTGQKVAAGVTAFSGADGSSTAVQATENGGVRMLTVISDPSAPTEYAYDIDVPGGATVEIRADGSAAVLDADGIAIATAEVPWARDASGVSVRSWFTTEGTNLTQHVDHRQAGVAYPVTADPWFWNYMGCVLGIGVPLGAAWVFATYAPSWQALNKIASSGSVISGRYVAGLLTYVNWVKARCAAFIRS